jgi:hypothetical protein
MLKLGELCILYSLHTASIAPHHKIKDTAIKYTHCFVIMSHIIKQEHQLCVKTAFFCVTTRVNW